MTGTHVEFFNTCGMLCFTHFLPWWDGFLAGIVENNMCNSMKPGRSNGFPRGGNSNIFLCSPLSLGFYDPIWRTTYFSKWVVKNHQLVMPSLDSDIHSSYTSSGKKVKHAFQEGFPPDVVKEARWWFQIFFVFTPIPGEMIQFDEHIFQTELKPPALLFVLGDFYFLPW